MTPESPLKSGQRVYIPNRAKYGTLERVATVEGKPGLRARVILDDLTEIWILPEYLQLVPNEENQV